VIEKYQQPSTWRAVWQLLNTFVPYALLWYLMHLSAAVSWWLTVPLAVVAGGLLMGIFIIFHDCGHGSYFKSRWANDALGFIAGVLPSLRTTSGAGNTRSTTAAPASWIIAAPGMSGP
jgi:omega-6 fatty acid desaturase (delta-12 desaturase)